MLHRTVQGCMLGVVIATSWVCASGQPGLPPEGVRASGDGNKVFYLLNDGGQYIKATVSVVTANKRLRIRWEAQDDPSVLPAHAHSFESVSFYPTAFAPSKRSSAMYVAGKNGLTTVLEKWTFGPFSLSQKDGRTVFPAPDISRGSLAIDQSLSNILDLAVNKHCPSDPSREEVWVFEFESRNVYGIDPDTGAKQLRIPSTKVGTYQSVVVRQHSVYGSVFIFYRYPFWISFNNRPSGPYPYDSVAFYDSDLDGVLDGEFVGSSVINWYDNYKSHPLFSTGEFLD